MIDRRSAGAAARVRRLGHRPLWIAGAALSLAVFVVSAVVLAGRIREYNAGRTAYAFMPVDARSFTFAGRPVSLTDEERQAGTVVVLRYGERERVLPAPIQPGPEAVPGLGRHADWLRVLRFAERGAAGSEEFHERLGRGADRLVVVVRRPRVAPDPRTGEVAPREYVYDFHELLADGTIRGHTLRHPKARGGREPRRDELRPNTWEMDAALSLMPGSPPDSLSFGRPTASFKEDALRAAGWTFPVAVASLLGLVACLAVLVSPRRGRKGD